MFILVIILCKFKYICFYYYYFFCASGLCVSALTHCSSLQNVTTEAIISLPHTFPLNVSVLGPAANFLWLLGGFLLLPQQKET